MYELVIPLLHIYQREVKTYSQKKKNLLKNTYENWPGAMAHVCIPSTLGVQSRQITSGQKSETSMANMVKPHLY